MDSIPNFSLFSDNCEDTLMEGLDLGLFPELEPLNTDLSDEDPFVDIKKVGVNDESMTPDCDLTLSAHNYTKLNDSYVQAQLKTPNNKQRIVKILIASQPKQVELVKAPETAPNLKSTRGNHIATTTEEKCGNGLSKNAIAARENRIKKKKYVEEIEKSVSIMSSEIQALKEQTSQHIEMIKTLKTENRYLRNVLANEKEISALLKTVKKTPGIKFSGSSITKRHRSSTEDDSSNEAQEPVPRKKRRADNSLSSVLSSEDDGFASDEPVGVCLHVASGTLSIEFCPTCSSRASLENLEPY